MDIYKCLIDDDPRLPKIKIDGSLPDVTVKITGMKYSFYVTTVCTYSLAALIVLHGFLYVYRISKFLLPLIVGPIAYQLNIDLSIFHIRMVV